MFQEVVVRFATHLLFCYYFFNPQLQRANKFHNANSLYFITQSRVQLHQLLVLTAVSENNQKTIEVVMSDLLFQMPKNQVPVPDPSRQHLRRQKIY